MKLYELDLSKVQAYKNEFKTALAEISNNILKEDFLTSLSTNARNHIFVLSDPMSLWPANGSPPVYCAIQVFLEGKIPNYPELEREESTDFISYFFQYFISMPLLIGARIVALFAPQDDLKEISLTLLTRYYNGEMAHVQIPPDIEEELIALGGRNLEKMHYIGVFAEPSLDGTEFWSTHGGFNLFFMQKLYEPAKGRKVLFCVMWKPLNDYDTDIALRDGCSLEDNFNFFGCFFIPHLNRFSELDLEFVMSVLNRFRATGLNYKLKLLKREKDLDMMHQLIDGTAGDPEEIISRLISRFTRAYFRDQKIQLNENQSRLLVLSGLRNKSFQQAAEIMNMDKSEVVASLRGAIITIFQFYDSLPEVVNERGPNVVTYYARAKSYSDYGLSEEDDSD